MALGGGAEFEEAVEDLVDGALVDEEGGDGHYRGAEQGGQCEVYGVRGRRRRR